MLSSTTMPPTSIPRVLALAGASSALDLPLHPDLGLLAQRRRNFFSNMTRQRIRRGVFRSIADLQAAINGYLAEHNATPNPLSTPNPPRRLKPNSNAALYHPSDSAH